ncbi:anti-sigma factor [Halobacillus litoralis]|uniref:anti-sigma factor n=1 Tax=Halobacillus litoralis TaxID=45668 RepID=UPI001CFC5EC0|nr:anti-sigma factor [Halobacillus litoralis]WLR46395.1 anti-sigma factor [Halobacillus litoralis]
MNDKQCENVLDYLNDQLTEKEKKEFENHLRECPDCQEEVKELENLMGDIPDYMKETTPPAGMRERILDGVFNDEEEHESEAEEKQTPVLSPKKPNKWKVWAGALAAGLLLSVGGNIFAGLQLQQLSSQNEDLESNLSDLQVALSELEDRENEDGDTVTPTKRTQLASTGEAGSGVATLVDRNIGSELLVQVEELSQLEGDQVYQVWLIQGENPEPAGAFTTDGEGNGAVTFRIGEENQKSWDAIAITKEPQPNNQLPEGEVVLQAEL